jgi:hypothetical protein
MTKLMSMQFKILYRKGNENLAAYALSWAAPLISLQTQLAIVSPDEQGFSLQRGIIRMGPHIWVGDSSALKTRLISAIHSTVLRGHLGIHATYYSIKKLFHGRA